MSNSSTSKKKTEEYALSRLLNSPLQLPKTENYLNFTFKNFEKEVEKQKEGAQNAN